MTPYFERDGIVIYHGRAEDVLPTLEAGSVDMVFTSPPYNLGNTTAGGAAPLGHYTVNDRLGGRGNRLGKWSGGSLASGYGEHGDALPHPDYVAWQQAILRDSWRLLSNRGAIFYNHKPRILGGRLITPFEYLPPELATAVRQVVIWSSRRAACSHHRSSTSIPIAETPASSAARSVVPEPMNGSSTDRGAAVSIARAGSASGNGAGCAVPDSWATFQTSPTPEAARSRSRHAARAITTSHSCVGM